ncbi:putative MFS family arabinose efflux permease [Variovorax sp. W2I14]
MLAAPIARDLAITTPTVFAAFSFALVVSAFLGPYAGRMIDRWGGRPVLMTTNVVFAAGLVLLGIADSMAGLFVAWAVLGVGMGSGLYEAAFAGLVRLYGRDSRGAITGITLFAGFASTVGWPLSTLLEANVGWRGACFGWAVLHIAIALPLNWLLPSVEGQIPTATQNAEIQQSTPTDGRGRWVASLMLATVFAVTWFISTAMAAHLPQLLVAAGATLGAAVAMGALIGPAQVGARILEFSVLRQVHPLLSARLAALMHPLGAAILALLGAPLAAAFVVLHGAGNGVLTIAKGTLPLVLFGPDGYGHRQGWLMVPARIAQALAPWLFGISIERWGIGALWVSGGLGIIAFAALMILRTGEAPEDRHAVEHG